MTEPTATPATATITHRRRLSPLRVVAALVLIGVTALLGAAAVERITTVTPSLPDAWFAPYVDVTLTPQFPFEDPQHNPATEVVLSFVVADLGDPCLPSWGGAYTLDQASADLDLERRIARVRRWGGNVVVSLGGERNDELAIVCHDEEQLAATYTEIVTRYDLATLDLDIEGSALADLDAVGRRSRAIKQVQDARKADDADLAIWLTLPVSPQGLTPDGVASVDSMLEAGVDLTGVNLMVMNFGESRGSMEMQDAIIEALDAAHTQIGNAYRRADMVLSADQIWRKLGATPMIGQNDVSSDVFNLAAAEALFQSQEERPLGRVSFWSLNRDGPCGPNVDPRSVSNHCSGILQQPNAFSTLFGDIEGSSSAAAEVVTVAVTAEDIIDDPATTPYPIWSEERSYPEDEKVVWRGNVYQAKWWTLGDRPDEPVISAWDTPWRMLGPVLPTDRPAPTTTLPEGIHPQWDGTAIYLEGTFVQWRGVVYEAKWWNSGEQPGINVPNESDTPWRRLEGSEARRNG